MEPLLLFPDPAPPALAQALDLSRLPVEGGWRRPRPPSGSSPTTAGPGAIVCADVDPEAAFALCRALRKRDLPLTPLLLLVAGCTSSASSSCARTSSTTSASTPWQGQELEARLAHLFWRTGRGTRPDLVEYGPLVLNLETYQAALSGRPLDLTYMEYELLKFLATHPGKVFTREVLLSRVWGYEYYGGARTVDVHIRRLRAKLGEEHANLISTVRSVGYRFGQSRWGLDAKPALRRRSAQVGPGLDLDPRPEGQAGHGEGGAGRAVVAEGGDVGVVHGRVVGDVGQEHRGLDHGVRDRRPPRPAGLEVGDRLGHLGATPPSTRAPSRRPTWPLQTSQSPARTTGV